MSDFKRFVLEVLLVGVIFTKFISKPNNSVLLIVILFGLYWFVLWLINYNLGQQEHYLTEIKGLEKED